MNKAPSIRFNGFTADWEQFKFSEITFPAGEKNKDNLPYESYSITNEDGFIPQDEKFGNCGIMWDADKRMYYIVSPQSFAYNPARINVGSIGYQNLDKTVIVSSLYEVFKTTEDVDDRFLWHWFKSNDFQKLIFQFQEGGVRLYFYYDKLCRGSIALPRVEEQKRIGAYLDQLDHLITLHQRKYEQMSSVLLSMRDKLFAKPNVPVPENRFAGSAGEWEIRRLGDIISPYSDPVPTPHNGYERLGIRSHGKGTFCSYVDVGAELETAQMHRVAANKMIVNITFAWEHAVAVTDKNDAGKLVSHRFPQFSLSEELHPRFLHYLILDERFRHHLFLASPGGAGRNRVLKIDEMLEYQVRVPKYEEQEKIANFLDSLEELTRLYTMRVEKLKNIKAACLEGMFV